MAKIIGIILSLVGNIGCFICTFLLMLLGTLASLGFMNSGDKYNVIAIVMFALVVALFIVAKIGNKISDKNLTDMGGAKIAKFRFINIANKVFFNDFILIIVCLGFFGLLVFGAIIQFGKNPFHIGNNQVYGSSIMIGAGCAFLAYPLSAALFDRYILTHCKYCGASMSGAGYEYEEVERSHRVSDGKLITASKIRFAFKCPSCKEENVHYLRMRTDAEKVEKFANKIVK